MAEASAEVIQDLSQDANSKRGTSRPRQREEKAWSGNKAKEFNIQRIRERTFQVRLPSQFSAKDVLMSINGVILKEEVETVSQQHTPGCWTIVAKTAEAANKLVLRNMITIGPEHEQYKIQPRVQKATLLTLPYVDPEISNTEIFYYFSYYGYVNRVVDEFYKDEGYTHVNTGRRLVFIRLADGASPPPYCIIKNQKMTVNFRGKSNVCFHCHVEGHGKARCPVQEYRTCYNCGSSTHNHSQCFEDTLVTYHFDNKEKYNPYCYPRYFKGEDYHITFEPKFYTERARIRYYTETYARKQQELDDNRQQDREKAIVEDIHYEEIDETMEMYEDATKEGRRDWGPPADTQNKTFDEPNADASGPSTNTQDDDKQSQYKPTPKPR